jgi:hypothetical protein
LKDAKLAVAKAGRWVDAMAGAMVAVSELSTVDLLDFLKAV